MDDTRKIQLDTLPSGNTSLIWWESKKQGDLIHYGKIIYSWIEFTTTLRKKFYPLAYMQTTMIDWKHLRQAKGKNVQAYTWEFRKEALSLGISIYS